MKRNARAIILLMMVSAFANGQANKPRQDGTTEQEIRSVRQKLVEAGRSKDPAAYEPLLAAGFTFVHSTGMAETRQQYIDHAVSGTALFQRADSQTLAEHITVYEGQTAIWTSHSAWRNRNDNGETILRSTNVYVKTGGRWQWAAGQSTRLRSRPKAAAID